jgi:hypothetical protein
MERRNQGRYIYVHGNHDGGFAHPLRWPAPSNGCALDPKRLLVRVDNTAREDYEPKVLLSIEGYATDSGRDARLMRNNEPVNLEMLILGQLRVLAGLRRKPD